MTGSLSGQQLKGLPENFPEIHLNAHDDPEPGYVFVTPCGLWGHFLDATPYLAIVDNLGTPVYYQELDIPAFDFKLQPNGYLSFSGGGYGHFNHIMDSTYEIIAHATVDGYNGTDFHEFRILENGNYLLLGWEDRIVDMDTVVPGGYPGVTVRGALIQEKDENGNILWQWSSWDHFNILETDTAHAVNIFSNSFIDYVHTNAVDQDTDTSILISSRNMHEITKINKNTGDLMWRMGGTQNEFTFIGDDTLGFSGQHHIRKLENGNYLLFDNGWFHPDLVSSALELQLDEINKTATVIKRYRSQPDDIYGVIMGSSQRLPGGHTLVGWGSGVPNVTEFKADGTKALELEFESVSYRAFKFPWKTNILCANTEHLDYGEIYYPNTANKNITITNNIDENIFITWIHNHTEKYYCTTSLPLQIGPGSSAEITLQFKPEEIGDFDDVMTIYGERENLTLQEAFALQLNVFGSASQEASIAQFDRGEISIYPNPSNGLIRITRNNVQEDTKYVVTNIHGQNVCMGIIPLGLQEWTINLNAKVSGMYFIHLRSLDSEKTGYWKIIKL
ncbi:MAG: arylsulfotransferase family protein [Bacteroidota bacterium]